MKLGLGCGSLGALDHDGAMRLLHRALELDVTFFDTARSYGDSEDKLGAFYAELPQADRTRVTLATKVGYGAAGHGDWTYGCVAANVDDALRRLRCERIGVVVLHSCGRDVLERGEAMRALIDAKAAGKVERIGYSGDDDGLGAALWGPHDIDVVQTSISLCDPWAVRYALSRARERGCLVVAKRAQASGALAPGRSHDDYAAAIYRDRWRTLEPELALDCDPREASLRFAAAHADVVLVGTRSAEHLEHARTTLAKGPLPADLGERIRSAHDRHAANWPGLV